jgi:hypothetical protein
VTIRNHERDMKPIYVRAAGRNAGPCRPWMPWDHKLASGDAVLYAADPTPEDLLIEAVTGSSIIHAGLLAWNSDEDRWEIVDTRQWHGARRTPLYDAVCKNPGHWLLFHADCNRWPEFNRRLCVEMADRFVSRRYGWVSLIRDGLHDLPLIGSLVPAGQLDDDPDRGRLPFCSELVLYCTLFGGGVDAIPNLPIQFCEPKHIAQSPFWQYSGTFWPDADEGN